MDIAKNDCDWAIALLIGVFGENAKLMRVYPRKSELQKFPLTFLVLAQTLYRERLKQKKYEGDIEKKVKSLPAYLSDRALDLAEARGTTSHKRLQKDKNKDNISKRQRKETETDVLPASTFISTTSSIAEKENDKSHDILSVSIEDNNDLSNI
ncbi:PREDICTED: uncharacterized protein LOC108775393 [Cyphomyrmex costatus]|uniref:uncharacterized protein LOC108775393 n=1 Tax=Cyphomyrmex costatus TaxID=456900 RepID=UPI000852385D|nr:PREDICTED: uncharacterized protein LOC108775393 [Cyphomyrmex costatus]